MSDVLLDKGQPWDRQEGEPDKPYAAFRLYKDTEAVQRSPGALAERVGVSKRTVRDWSLRWNWADRVHAWDDTCHELEDSERLEAIRAMHAIHRRVGRSAIVLAERALQGVDPADVTPAMAARLLELGTKLERSTLIVNVEELLGIEVIEEAEDAWEKIARELDPASASVDR